MKKPPQRAARRESHREEGAFGLNSNSAYQYQDERRKELINGIIVAMAPVSIDHAYVAGSIFCIFKNYLKGKNCIPFGNGILVHLTDKDIFLPDMIVVCDRNKIKPDGVHGAPDLVVEVLSPSTAKNDRMYKMDIYEQCGVPEYWIVNPGSKSIEVYLLNNGKYILHDVYTVRPDWMLEQMTDEEKAALVTEFKCHLYDDLLIRLDDVFADPF